MTIVLALIALVASMLMVCLLFMFIQYKRKDIAILRALGASSHDVYRIFRRLGMMIVFRASAAGLLSAALIGWWLDTFRPITLPSIYIVTHLPAAVEPMSFFTIFMVTLLLGYCACLIPLRQLRGMGVAQVLREG
jgi:lipoprotein-releasing system permease protein